MRDDSLGLLWQDLPKAKAAGKRGPAELGPMPPIPDTGWKPPTEFPNLAHASSLAVDTETYDPDLLKYGPGWGRGSGHIVGVSISAPGTRGWYFPLRHEVESEYNMDYQQVHRYLKHLLELPMPKIGANLMYDYGWLYEEGIRMGGPLYDPQFAEALLNSETPNVALDDLAQYHLGVGKETSLLYQWCADWYGGAATAKQRKNIYRSPPRLVGPYAEADATLPMAVMAKQWPLLEQRGVLGLFKMECGLIRMLHDMRRKGAPIDIAYAEQFDAELTTSIDALQQRINTIAGMPLNVNSGASMQRAFDHLGLPYGKTSDGNASFTKTVLQQTKHKLTASILDLRELEKTRGTFVRSYMLESHVGGFVHGQFHPLRKDGNGARSGRLASSTPNLQNIPIRTEIGAKVRAAFIATGRRWRSIDYSQIEYRLFAHYAIGQGSDAIRQRYVDDPDTDYHQATIDLVMQHTGIELARGSAKGINFGLLYGMGKPKIVATLGANGELVYSSYHTAAPFVRSTADACSRQANDMGYIDTVLGRRSDFTLWESSADYGTMGLPLEQALAAYGPQLRRYKTHKALNRRLQGSAADVMKAAMWRLYHDGALDAVGMPCLTVHDELDWDDDGRGSDADWAEVQHIMENAVPGISVPIRVDVADGNNWAQCK